MFHAYFTCRRYWSRQLSPPLCRWRNWGLEKGHHGQSFHCSLLCKRIIYTALPTVKWLCCPTGWERFPNPLSALANGVWVNVSYKGLAAPLRATAYANEPLVLSLSQENSSLTSELLLPPGCQMRTQKPWSKTVSNDPKPPTCTVSGEHVCCFKSLGDGGYWFLQQSSKWQSQDPNLSRCNLNTIKFTCFSVQINDFTIWYGAAIVTI